MNLKIINIINYKMTSYFDIYLNQLFTTLGQLTAVLVSSSVAVPVYSYYSRRIVRDQLREFVAEHKRQFKQEDLD
jgi:hypothetical protein